MSTPYAETLPLLQLTDALGRDRDSQVVLSHKFKDGTFQSGYKGSLGGVSDADIPVNADCYYSVQPLVPPSSGRGRIADVVGLSVLFADLDGQPGKLESLENCWKVVAALEEMLGSAAAAVVSTGHGLHPYWTVTGPGTLWDASDEVTRERAKQVLKTFGDMVETAAQRVQGATRAEFDTCRGSVEVGSRWVDAGVYELSRVLRVPGTHNLKDGEGLPVMLERVVPLARPVSFEQIEATATEWDVWPKPGESQTTVQGAPRAVDLVMITKVKESQERRDPYLDMGRFLDGLKRLGITATRSTSIKYSDGQEWRSQCPVHAADGASHSRDSLSFGVSNDTGMERLVWRCFADCDPMAVWRLVASDPVQEGDMADDHVSSWTPVDVGEVLASPIPQTVPTLMPRSDGLCLLYEGKVHSLHGESESGKSFVAQAEAARLLGLGCKVLIIDFESDAHTIVERLMLLGATADQIRTGLTYVRPDAGPRASKEDRAAFESLLHKSFTLAIIDGVTDAMGLWGTKSSMDNDEVAQFMRDFPRRLATTTSAAVVLIDHVTKDAQTRGRFAIGGQAKMNGLDGAAYTVSIAAPLGRGLVGKVILKVGKDRPGAVRAKAGDWKSTDRTQPVCEVTFDSTSGEGIVFSFGRPDSKAQTSFRPTNYMEKISVELESAGSPVSQNTLLERVSGKAEFKRAALRVLVEEEFVGVKVGARGAQMHSSILRYRESEDPVSDRYDGTRSTLG